jgi:hypothetical protein
MCSIYVSSYDSQGYGEGILTRLHTGRCVLAVALDSGMSNGWSFGKGLKRDIDILLKTLSRHLLGRTEENYEYSHQ